MQLFRNVVCTTDRDSVLVFVVSENKQMGITNTKQKLSKEAGKNRSFGSEFVRHEKTLAT